MSADDLIREELGPWRTDPKMEDGIVMIIDPKQMQHDEPVTFSGNLTVTMDKPMSIIKQIKALPGPDAPPNYFMDGSYAPDPPLRLDVEQLKALAEFVARCDRLQKTGIDGDFDIVQTGRGDWMIFTTTYTDLNGQRYATPLEAFAAIQEAEKL